MLKSSVCEAGRCSAIRLQLLALQIDWNHPLGVEGLLSPCGFYDLTILPNPCGVIKNPNGTVNTTLPVFGDSSRWGYIPGRLRREVKQPSSGVGARRLARTTMIFRRIDSQSIPNSLGVSEHSRYQPTCVRILCCSCDSSLGALPIYFTVVKMSSDCGFPTATSEEQKEVEMAVLRLFGQVINSPDFHPEKSFTLNKQIHIDFLKMALLEPLRPSFISLEASRPWIIYWVLHALDLLGARALILSEFHESVPSFLSCCQSPTGGFGGGPHQIPHLATTYAAVSALVCVGTERALSVIDRHMMKRFILSLKDESSGGFRMHENGETDIRGTYCAIAVASLTQVLDEDVASGVADYVMSCQTYEGGIAGEPGMEAHGGYTYCGLAAVAILGVAQDCLDLHSLVAWLCRRQQPLEGGFNGRANKLVDSCYTFWQGAALSLTQQLMPVRPMLFTPEPAQMYVLLACQVESGGFRDKPGKSPDYYHSCYALSGLAALQRPLGPEKGSMHVVGPTSNLLEANCCFYNNVVERVKFARNYFTNINDGIGNEGPGTANLYPS